MKKQASTSKAPGRPREDFVQFRLKANAPDFVALGGARFSGAYRREEGPFECTLGEWKVFLHKTGFFEELLEV